MLARTPDCIRARCIDHGKQGCISLLIFLRCARQGTHYSQIAFILYQQILQGGFADVGRADNNHAVLLAVGLPDLGRG